MSETRWCLRCGVRKPLAEFKADPKRIKRKVATNCLQCVGRIYADPAKPDGVARCHWCRKRYTKLADNQRFCDVAHRNAWWRAQWGGKAS